MVKNERRKLAAVTAPTLRCFRPEINDELIHCIQYGT